MSSSTVILKHPSNANNELSAKSKHQYFKFFSVCMWGLLAIITAANKEFADNVTGISVTITTQDCLSMLVSTWLLAKGLKDSYEFFIIPWLLMFGWSIYDYHCLNLYKMYNILQRSRRKGILPWIAIGVDALGLSLKVLLAIRILLLGVDQWYNRKLRNEIKGI